MTCPNSSPRRVKLNPAAMLRGKVTAAPRRARRWHSVQNSIFTPTAAMSAVALPARLDERGQLRHIIGQLEVKVDLYNNEQRADERHQRLPLPHAFEKFYHGCVSLRLHVSVRILSILRSKTAMQRRKCAKSSSLSPLASCSANECCSTRPCAMMGAAFSVQRSIVFRRVARHARRPAAEDTPPSPAGRHGTTRCSASARACGRRPRPCMAVSGIVRKKQQDVHRGGRQLRLLAERGKDGVVGVHESCRVGKHRGRGQGKLRRSAIPPMSNSLISN